MSGHPLGFVIVMRARISVEGCRSYTEWLIVSRWGTGGEFLSAAQTGVRVRGGPVPLGLKPRRTMFAQLAGPSARHGDALFRLTRQVPVGMTLAGAFIASEGCLRLRGAAACLTGPGRSGKRRWRLLARKSPWGQEFVEPPAAPSRASNDGLTQPVV